MSKKIKWVEVRDHWKAWLHVQCVLTMETDRAICLHCKAEESLQSGERTRHSLLREFARKHYYKHKLWEEEWAQRIVSPRPPDSVPLFT